MIIEISCTKNKDGSQLIQLKLATDGKSSLDRNVLSVLKRPASAASKVKVKAKARTGPLKKAIAKKPIAKKAMVKKSANRRGTGKGKPLTDDLRKP